MVLLEGHRIRREAHARRKRERIEREIERMKRKVNSGNFDYLLQRTKAPPLLPPLDEKPLSHAMDIYQPITSPISEIDSPRISDHGDFIDVFAP